MLKLEKNNTAPSLCSSKILETHLNTCTCISENSYLPCLNVLLTKAQVCVNRLASARQHKIKGVQTQRNGTNVVFWKMSTANVVVADVAADSCSAEEARMSAAS